MKKYNVVIIEDGHKTERVVTEKQVRAEQEMQGERINKWYVLRYLMYKDIAGSFTTITIHIKEIK